MSTQPRNQGYKSPLRKLVPFFKKSRDQWKAKFQESKVKLERLRNRVRFLERSKSEWKAEAQELRHKNKRLESENAKLKIQLAEKVKKKRRSRRSSL